MPTSMTQRLMLKWRRHCFEVIMQWEMVLRGFFVEFPKFIFEHVESARTIVSFFFVYVMLQVRMRLRWQSCDCWLID